MKQTNPQVDGYLRKSKEWQEELKALRAIILDSQLTEEVKWRAPCYTLDGRNVVLIHRFKEYCALMFFKGALLKDAKAILTKPGEHMQAGRQIRFTGVQQITGLKPILKAYIQEAIAVEKAGLKVPLKKTTDFIIPEEFQKKLNEDARLKAAFDNLTPGRQRGYILYFSGAKQTKTRESRVEKSLERILSGKGLDD